MEINVKTAVMSHLSDAQELINMGLINGGGVHAHINFAKALVLKYPNTEVFVKEEELNELWQQVITK